jgi:RNA polymerase sigma-70 factor (ECF subfamily)
VNRDWVRLVERARDREVEAFGELVERFKGAVCALIHGVIRDWHQTQDVAQDTFAAVWSRLADLREPRSFRTWLFRIAHNNAINHLRRLGARPTQSMKGEDLDVLRYPLRPDCSLITAEGPPEPCMARRLVRTIMALPNGYGGLLLMRYVEDMSLAEIARVTDRSEKAVKAALYRARLLAREVLTQAGLTFERVKDEL